MIRALLPISRALPRSAGGFLEPSAVRYLLHRYFIDQHGWFVPAAGSRGEVANESLPEVIIGQGSLASTLASRLGARGLSLQEVAVLAVAVEALASRETVERLQAAYRLRGVSVLQDHAHPADLEYIHKYYFMLYILGSDYRRISMPEAVATLVDIRTSIPKWDELLVWAGEVRQEVSTSKPELAGQWHTFAGQVRFFEEVQHRYGRWQDQECVAVKAALVEQASPGTGRVPFHAFRATSLPNGWTTEDTEESLAQVGALDLTDPLRPRVIIPNYLDSTENCDDPSRYYSVCCISGCESLLAHLERELGSPQALPSRIVELVEQLPAASVKAPRTLSAQLVRRLAGIAAAHGGHAPLHGRLFRQWMHHAYPEECSFPHVSADSKVMVSAPQPAADGEGTQGVDEADEAEELPWHEEEELFMQSATRAAHTPDVASISSRVVWRGAVMLMIACCMAWRLAHMLAPAAVALRRHLGRAAVRSQGEPKFV